MNTCTTLNIGVCGACDDDEVDVEKCKACGGYLCEDCTEQTECVVCGESLCADDDCRKTTACEQAELCYECWDDGYECADEITGEVCSACRRDREDEEADPDRRYRINDMW